MKYIERINRRKVKNLKVKSFVINFKDLGKKLGIKIVGIVPRRDEQAEFLIEVKKENEKTK